MANIKSQIKRNRQNEKRRLRNRVFRGEARTAIKKARVAIQTGDPEASKAAVLLAIRKLDRAAQHGVLHRNNVARRKSRLMKALASMEVKEVAAPAAEVQPEAAEAPKAKRAAASKPKAKEEAVEEPKAKKPASAEKKTAAKKTSAKES